MTIKEAITLFKYYLQANHKERIIESYSLLINRFGAIYAQTFIKIRQMQTLRKTF